MISLMELVDPALRKHHVLDADDRKRNDKQAQILRECGRNFSTRAGGPTDGAVLCWRCPVKSHIEAALLEVLADEHANEWDADVDELARNQSPTLQRMMFETLTLLHNELDYHPSVNELRVLDEFAARILRAGMIYGKEPNETRSALLAS